MESAMTLDAHPFPPSVHPRNTILLVEDEPFIREATAAMLETAGFSVLSAEDPHQAMNVFEEHNSEIDLLMTDMVLPGGTGQQLGQDLRQRSPEISILVTSGYSNAEDDLELPGSRQYFLAKPYSRRALVDKVAKILADAPLAQARAHAG
jgi:DNA-binding NtrC family response regulator